MVERVRAIKGVESAGRRRVKAVTKSGRGGKRPGAGRKKGSVTEIKRVARARAARDEDGRLPHELLLDWARTGMMDGEKLAPETRISAAKGCAAWFKPPMQAVKMQGEINQSVVVTLDQEALATLAKSKPEVVPVLRTVLEAIAAAGGGGAGVDVGALVGGGAQQVSASLYGDSLTPDSETAGRA